MGRIGKLILDHNMYELYLNLFHLSPYSNPDLMMVLMYANPDEVKSLNDNTIKLGFNTPRDVWKHMFELLIRSGYSVLLVPYYNYLRLNLGFVKEKDYNIIIGGTVLHGAVLFNNIYAVQVLLSEFPELINYFSDQEYTSLDIAIYNNNIDIVKLLLDKGADIDPPEENYGVRLHSHNASFIRKSTLKYLYYIDVSDDIKRLLVDHINKPDYIPDNNILHIIFSEDPKNMSSKIHEVSRIFEISDDDLINMYIDKPNKDGITPYMLAVYNNITDIINRYTTKERINNVEPDYLVKKPDLVRKFISYIDINRRLNNGRTLVSAFFDIGDYDMVKFLLDNGAKVDVGTLKPNVRLVDRPDIIKSLISYIDINRPMDNGKTLLSTYIDKGDYDMIKFLLDNGVKVDKDLIKPDYIVNKPDMIRLFISYIDVNRPLNNGKTLVRVYVEKGDYDMVKFLIDNGAKLDDVDFTINKDVTFSNKVQNYYYLRNLKPYKQAELWELICETNDKELVFRIEEGLRYLKGDDWVNNRTIKDMCDYMNSDQFKLDLEKYSKRVMNDILNKPKNDTDLNSNPLWYHIPERLINFDGYYFTPSEIRKIYDENGKFINPYTKKSYDIDNIKEFDSLFPSMSPLGEMLMVVGQVSISEPHEEAMRIYNLESNNSLNQTYINDLARKGYDKIKEFFDAITHYTTIPIPKLNSGIFQGKDWKYNVIDIVNILTMMRDDAKVKGISEGFDLMVKSITNGTIEL